MLNSRFILFASLSLAAVAGCYLNLGDGGGNGNGNTNTGPGSTLPTDLPCDVANALLTCQACHGPTPSANAPMSLASYADLTAQSPQYAGQTEAQRAVARMSGSPSFMPPPPQSPSPQASIDAISAWINAGYPTGTCGSQSVCTSGQNATSHESARMDPGQACISCHQSSGGEAPMYMFMGTVYPTVHEPDGCIGATPTSYAGVQVVIVDAQGNSFPMTPNSSGNFLASPGGVQLPFTAKVTYQGREIDMVTPQTNGDCNSCHTETGTNGAPGRIMLP